MLECVCVCVCRAGGPPCNQSRNTSPFSIWHFFFSFFFFFTTHRQTQWGGQESSKTHCSGQISLWTHTGWTHTEDTSVQSQWQAEVTLLHSGSRNQSLLAVFYNLVSFLWILCQDSLKSNSNTLSYLLLLSYYCLAAVEKATSELAQVAMQPLSSAGRAGVPRTVRAIKGPKNKE